MIRIKRIKDKETLIDALCMIAEDMSQFNLGDSSSRVHMSNLLKSIRGEN
jgi:hypothetical protein